MGDFERTVREFKRTLTGGRQKTAPLDIMGKVTRVEDGVAWVRFAGSEVGDTPVRMNIDCKEGDVVQVRSSDGKAWIVGNQSAPPTDDSKAKEVEQKTEKFAERIKSVEKVAGDAADVANAVNQKVWEDEAGLHIADGKQDAAAERNSIWNSLGMLFRKGLNPILGILTGDNPRVAIYDGQGSGEEHEVASFGSTARIGGNSEYAAVVGAGRFGIESGDNVSLFNISPSGNPTADIHTVQKYVPPSTKTYTLEYTPVNGTSIQCNYSYDARSGSGVIAIGKIMFTAGSFGTKSKTERGTTVTVTYSSPQTFTMSVSYSKGNEKLDHFAYKTLGASVDLGILTFGTRRDGSSFGNNSATIGNNLLAPYNYQTVVGKNNKEYNGPFVVGNGDVGSYSSAFAVDWGGNVKAKGDIYVNCNADSSGGKKIGEMKTLLSTASYMGGNQDLTFSEPVSEQLTGIVLVWSWWSGSQAEDWGWRTFFIPKAMVQLHNGVGYDCPLSRPKSTYFGHKYVYIHDTHIVGHADNVATGTANGVPYANNKWVLRYVFGC